MRCLVLIFEDNEGAIFLAKNQQVSMRTKHIDVRYHFIRDLIQDGYLNLQYVSTDNNYADFMTKNVSKDILRKLFSSGVQNGDIMIKRENVGRSRLVGTEMAGDNSPGNVLINDGTHQSRKGSCE